MYVSFTHCTWLFSIKRLIFCIISLILWAGLEGAWDAGVGVSNSIFDYMLVTQACSQGGKQGSQGILPGSTSLYPSYHPSLSNSLHPVLVLWWFPSLHSFPSFFSRCQLVVEILELVLYVSFFPPFPSLQLSLLSYDILNFSFQALWLNFKFWYLHLKKEASQGRGTKRCSL